MLIPIVNLILRVVCLATVGNKMENNLENVDFTENVHIINFLKIRQGCRNK